MTAFQPVPDRPFTNAELDHLGLSRRQVEGWLATGEVTRIFRGVYAPGPATDLARARAEAIGHLAGPDLVVADIAAASLHGVSCQDPADLDVTPPLQVVSLRGHDRRRRPELLAGSRDLSPDEITMVDGIRVTTPLRTACDVACLRGRSRALAALDSFARAFDLEVSDFVQMLPRYRGRRGCLQLKDLVPRLDPRAESPGESWTRLAIIDAGLPVPDPQRWVLLPGIGWVRLDMALKHVRIAVEYDGEEFHGPEQREHDAERRQALRRAGWSVIVVTKDQLSGPALHAWLAEYRRLLDLRLPVSQRRYARGPRVA